MSICISPVETEPLSPLRSCGGLGDDVHFRPGMAVSGSLGAVLERNS